MKKKYKYMGGHRVEIKEEEHSFGKDKHTGKPKACDRCIKCVGCKKIHEKTMFMKHKTGFNGLGWYCDKWGKGGTLTPEQKMKNMSPEDVVSGVQYGYERDKSYGEDSKTGFIEEHAAEVKAFKEAIE